MDNDSSIKKALVKTYRRIRLKIDYIGMSLMNDVDGNQTIADLLKSDSPFMVARFGAVEMHCVSKWIQQKEYSKKEREQALYAAGIFPNDKDTLDRFCEIYTSSMNQCDILGVWEVIGEKKVIKKYCSNVKLIPSKSIEPYYFDEPWSMHLKGKKVLIIHPFVNSISKQLQIKDKVWMNKKVLPVLEKVEYIKAIQSNAGGETDFDNWFLALEYMKNQIDQVEFDVALIGAGAYGLPLAAYIKEKGKQAIQMSGATQILFGIKGKRWDNHPIISKFYNDSWVRPDELETPPQIQKVEGGSYW